MIYDKLKNLFGSVFKLQTRQSELEAYLISKNVKSTADVEHYIREFEQRGLGRSIWW